MLREPERWGEKCVTAFEKKQKAGVTWDDSYKHFEKRQAAMEAYESLGGKENDYASANAATTLPDDLHLAVKEAVSQSSSEAAMAVAEVKTLTQKVDQLTDALALIAQTAAANNKNKKGSRQQEQEEESDSSSGESESDSESEEEPPTPPPKKKPKQKKKGKAAANKGDKGKGKAFRMGRAYKPGMPYDPEWSSQKRAAYVAARREYHHTGTKAAQTDRVAMLRATYKRHKAEGNEKRYKSVKKVYQKAKQKLSALE